MPLTLTKCEAHHLDELVLLSRKTFRDAFEAWNDPVDFKDYMDRAFKKETLVAQWENPDTEFYFVKGEDVTLGYIKLNQNTAQTDLKQPDTIELERIYVLETFQGNGFGAWMLNQAKRIGKSKAKRFLWLGVWERNAQAIKFYEKQGFVKFDTHPYCIGKDEQTDWLMRFDLTTFDKD